jgi:hypothetical protein
VSGSTQSLSGVDSGTSGFERLHAAVAGSMLLEAARGQAVVDFGHGAPKITSWLRERVAASVTVVDRESCESADLGAVSPNVRSNAYDVAFSLRTFAHLGDDDASSVVQAQKMLAAVAEVLRPGGTAIIEIANPRSLRGLVEGIRNPVTVIRQAPRDHFVFSDAFRLTRFDTVGSLFSMLPEALRGVRMTGVGIVSPSDYLLDIPLFGAPLAAVERQLSRSDFLKRFGAFLLVNLRKV